MTENSAVSLICPKCKNRFEAEIHSQAVCPICGNTMDTDNEYEKTKSFETEKNVAAYRLMSSADAFFSKKSYDEAYTSYSAVIDADPNCAKAFFRRELTCQYLMQETSSVYLNCDSFFEKLESLKKQTGIYSELPNEEVKKLGLLVYKDILDFISCRADYEKRYPDTTGKSEAAETCMKNLIRLLAYTEDTMRWLMKGMDSSCKRDKAYTVLKCLDTGNKIYDMLLKGVEYTEIPKGMQLPEDGTVSDFTVKKKRILNKEEASEAGGYIDGMREAKEEMLRVISDKLYKEINEAQRRNASADKKKSSSESYDRSEYEQWHARNQSQYFAADKRMVIFRIASKASAVFAGVMLAIFIVEVFLDTKTNWTFISALVLAAVSVVSEILHRLAAKKKNFYTEVLERGSSTIRADSSSFDV